ncbi:hypothetical protein [Enterococcus mundtii]
MDYNWEKFVVCLRLKIQKIENIFGLENIKDSLLLFNLEKT